VTQSFNKFAVHHLQQLSMPLHYFQHAITLEMNGISSVMYSFKRYLHCCL